MRVWSTQRPVSIGTYPREYGVIRIVNFDQRTMVPEIGRLAFGYIDYEQDVPPQVQRHYDLWAEKREDPRLEGAARALARALKVGDMERAYRVIDKACDLGIVENGDKLVVASERYMRQ